MARINWTAVEAITGVVAAAATVIGLAFAYQELRSRDSSPSYEPTPSVAPGQSTTSAPTLGPLSTPEQPTLTETPVPETATSSVDPLRMETPTPAETATARKPVPTDDTFLLAKPIRMELIRVPAGEFLMGSDPAKDKQAYDDEQPQQPVTLAEFYIGKQEVTNAQYAVFVEATGHDIPDHWVNGRVPAGKEDFPVVYVSWDDAIAFTQWLREETGIAFRLPSEAEWEKACRGTGDLIYPWGDVFDTIKANTEESGIGDTMPVGTYSPAGDSPYGIADMSGNVWEWTSSIWKKYPYDPQDGRENLGIPGTMRVLRGGSFNNKVKRARCASHRSGNADFRLDGHGLRVAASPSP